jgi:hypothetical protein
LLAAFETICSATYCIAGETHEDPTIGILVVQVRRIRAISGDVFRRPTGETNSAVILRCSPHSGEPRRMGHKRLRPSFETPRKRAAPQDDG